MKKKVTFSINCQTPMTGTLIAVDFVNRTATIEIDEPEPDPEPLELWGEQPVITGAYSGKWVISYLYANDSLVGLFTLCTQQYPTRSEAITAWNRIATALNEIGEK